MSGEMNGTVLVLLAALILGKFRDKEATSLDFRETTKVELIVGSWYIIEHTVPSENADFGFVRVHSCSITAKGFS
ncbi:hypothetical protein Leryth_010951 [Lithospermum erythrorhizon]|nr:hypothetical protein Leryth_010951 [Lithospermum erythrorhizon]